MIEISRRLLGSVAAGSLVAATGIDDDAAQSAQNTFIFVSGAYMKPFSRVLLPLLLMAFGAVSAHADDKDDVLAANTQVEQAFTKLDVTAIEATWAQDGSVSVIHPASKAPILGWEGVQESYVDHPVRYKDFAVVMDNPQVTVKDNVAWVVGIEKVYAHRANGDVLDISALATNIFEKRSGKWLLVHHHASRMP